MNQREMEILGRLLQRANPPPILHRYRKPTKHTLEELRDHKIYAAMPDDLNDPFEHRGPISIDLPAFRKQFVEEFAPSRGICREQAEQEFDASAHLFGPKLFAGVDQLRKDSGVICLTAVPNSIRMWSYYADAHKGICIGYDTTVFPFMMAMQVTYRNPEGSLDVAAVLRDDPSQLADHISLRKAAEWEFEREYRIPLG